jgi:folate-dependent phosphoribosylglycinamide formyltransferase PurN
MRPRLSAIRWIVPGSNADATPRIVLCHIGSLSCLPALNLVFAELGDQIGLVLSSRVFAPRHGGFLRQTLDSFRRLGVPLTLWFGFDLISVQVVSRIARWTRFVIRRPPALATLDALAARYGARLVETGDVNSAETLAVVRAYAPDFVVVMNFDQILKAPFIALPRRGTINIHPSLLPALRGPCPTIWALAQRRSGSGATIHLIEDEKIDAGPVLAQVEVPLDRNPSAAEVNTRLFLAGAGALRATLERFAADPGMGRRQVLAEGQYLGFPTATEITTLRRSGVRLFRVRHAVRLIAAVLGWPSKLGGSVT